ncbi:hypothetical protein DJ81_11160 [Halorubrum sp. Hd13]|nr:hypothetical protein DJ81_11160 [Halorubrum sp. Hd13]OYR51802.1 hypothetical protein DJ74_03040 [Halorubrum sp. Ea8]
MEVFTVSLRTTTYSRAAGALEVFTVALQSTNYKRAAGASEAVLSDRRSDIKIAEPQYRSRVQKIPENST